MNVAKQGLVFVCLLDWITATVTAVAGVEAKAYFRGRNSVEQLLGFTRGFNVSSDMRMKHQIEPKIGRNTLGFAHQFRYLAPLGGLKGLTSVGRHPPSKVLALRR